MSPAKHLAICAEIQQLHQVRIAQLEAQKRTWVGLTEAEMFRIDPDGFHEGLPQMIEAKLKEKNT